MFFTFFSVIFVPKSVSQENKPILENWFKQNETIVHGQWAARGSVLSDLPACAPVPLLQPRQTLGSARSLLVLRRLCVGQGHEDCRRIWGKTKGFLVSPVFPAPFPGVLDGCSPPRFPKALGYLRFAHAGTRSLMCVLHGVSRSPTGSNCSVSRDPINARVKVSLPFDTRRLALSWVEATRVGFCC